MKIFAEMEKLSKFAATNHMKVAVMLSLIVGIFCVYNSIYGAITPHIRCNGVYSHLSGDLSAGSIAPFYFAAIQKLNSFSAMTNRNESSSKRNRPIHETDTSNATLPLQVSNPYGIVCFADLAAEMQKHFDVEKNAKNRAYSFILSCGMLHRFAEFCRSNYSDDWHDTCSRSIELLVTTQN